MDFPKQRQFWDERILRFPTTWFRGGGRTDLIANKNLKETCQIAVELMKDQPAEMESHDIPNRELLIEHLVNNSDYDNAWRLAWYRSSTSEPEWLRLVFATLIQTGKDEQLKQFIAESAPAGLSKEDAALRQSFIRLALALALLEFEPQAACPVGTVPTHQPLHLVIIGFQSTIAPETVMPRYRFFVLWPALLLFTGFSFINSVSAQENPASFKLEVDAGEIDRVNAIVRVEIPVKDLVAGPYILKDETTGLEIPGQFDTPRMGKITAFVAEHGDSLEPGKLPVIFGDLTFVLPKLAAGEKLTLTATASSDRRKNYRWEDDGTTRSELLFDDAPVMTYMYESVDDSSPERRAETYKVFHHVYTPDGSRLLTKGAGGLFPHHRGIFFGFNQITYGNNQKADTWHCNNGESQVSKFAGSIGGSVQGYSLSTIVWNGQDGIPFATEIRELLAIRIENATVIDFATGLQPLAANLRLAGDPQHAGVQFRATQLVPDQTKHLTYYIRPDGQARPGEFRNWSNKENETEVNKAHINLKWHALCIALPKGSGETGPEDGKMLEEKDVQRYTICYLPSEQNPEPARFSERDYGRFGSYFEYDFKKEGLRKPLQLRYRYWIQEGEMDVDEIEAISRSWQNPVTAGLVK